MTIGRAGLFGIETHALTKCSQVVIVFMAKSQRAISCLWHAGRVNQVRWGQKVCQRRCACALPKGKSKVKSTSTMAKMCFLWSIMLLTQLTAKIHTKLHASNGTEIFNFFVFVFFFAKVDLKISRFTVGKLLQLAKKGSGRGGGGGVAGGLIFDFPMRTGRAI